MTADEVIKLLKLKPHPMEGGFFVESYRSDAKTNTYGSDGWYGTDKSYATAIYYLLTPDTFSALHRLPTDELFHFYLGDAVTMLRLFPDGKSSVTTMGQEIQFGQKVQLLVPSGVWQGMYLKPGGSWALMGTTMSPGFEYEDYEAGDKETLSEQYPEHAELIAELTR